MESLIKTKNCQRVFLHLELRVLIWNFLPKEERKSALIKIDHRLKSIKLLQHVCDFI